LHARARARDLAQPRRRAHPVSITETAACAAHTHASRLRCCVRAHSCFAISVRCLRRCSSACAAPRSSASRTHSARSAPSAAAHLQRRVCVQRRVACACIHRTCRSVVRIHVQRQRGEAPCARHALRRCADARVRAGEREGSSQA
jgi:hypothetical protein